VAEEAARGAERAVASGAGLPHHLEGVLGHALDDAQLAQQIPEEQYCAYSKKTKVINKQRYA
jgi:hypothetical protein